MNFSGWQTKLHETIAKLRGAGERMPFALRLTLALVFLVLGIAGLFLPILQGGLFLFLAAWLIFPKHSELWLEKIKNRFRKKASQQTSKPENVP